MFFKPAGCCLSSWPTVLCAKILTVDITCSDFNRNIFFYTCYACSQQWPLLLYTTFSDIDLGWGHRVSGKQNLLASCTHAFSANQDKIIYNVEVIQYKHVDPAFLWCLRMKGNNCYFTYCIQKITLDAFKHLWSDIFLLLFFFFFFFLHMMDITELYISLVVTWALIQGHRDTRKPKLFCRSFHKVLYWFGWYLECSLDLLIYWTSQLFYFSQ